jgi:outer membrane protein assembly factor BamD (BamD/ComL family)
VRSDDPTGPLADDAVMATANAYFKHGRWDDADYHYGLLRNEYPKSEFQYQAHLLGLQTKLKKYQGADYEGKPLDEAEELINQLVTQFPRELGDERERMLKIRAEIRTQKAMREWNIAEFYSQSKHYGAARIYYENIAKTYPDTSVAKEALAKIGEIKDLPAEPTSHLKWLEELFPESKKNGPSIASRPDGTRTR